MKLNKKIILSALIFSSASMAQLTKADDNGIREILGGCAGGAAIADDAYDGSIGSMQCMDVVGPGGVITDMNLDLAVDHTWVGDLAVKIVAPGGQILTVMNRPGFAEPADDGTGGFGFNENLLGSSPLNFANGGTTDAEQLGASNGTDNVVCQDDGLCSYSPNSGMGEGTDFSDFIGMESAGTWQVCVGDAGGQDTGSLCPATTINFTAGPPPSADVSVEPASGSNLNFGSGGTSGSSSVTISNAASANVDITNVNCSFSGGDSANFTVDTLLPGGPIAPGGSLTIALSATVSGSQNLASTLTCTYDGDAGNTSSSWSATISGRPQVIPTLGFYSTLGLMALVLFGAVVARRKFI